MNIAIKLDENRLDENRLRSTLAVKLQELDQLMKKIVVGCKYGSSGGNNINIKECNVIGIKAKMIIEYYDKIEKILCEISKEIDGNIYNFKIIDKMSKELIGLRKAVIGYDTEIKLKELKNIRDKWVNFGIRTVSNNEIEYVLSGIENIHFTFTSDIKMFLKRHGK